MDAPLTSFIHCFLKRVSGSFIDKTENALSTTRVVLGQTTLGREP